LVLIFIGATGGALAIEMRSIVANHRVATFTDALAEPLPFRIPVVQIRLVNEFPDVFVHGTAEYQSSVDCWMEHQQVGESEVAVTSLDSNWINVIQKCVQIAILRDQHDPSSMPYLRPDATLQRQGATFMKVESKPSPLALPSAREELVGKFYRGATEVFPQGSMSMLGILTTPTQIELHRITYDNHFNRFDTVLIREYDVSAVGGRLSFIVDIFKLCRWVASITSPNQVFHLVPNLRTETPNHHHITWCAQGLMKEYRITSANAARFSVMLQRMEQVYNATLPHVEWGRRIVDTNNIMITRIGRRLRLCIMNGTVSRQQAISEVELGLQELHKLGFAHCDVWIENVFVDQNNVVFIDDLEYLVPLQDPPIAHNYRLPAGAVIPTTGLDLDKAQFLAFQATIATL
jgi:hypothetical protein